MRAPLIGILSGEQPHASGRFLDQITSACVRIYGARHAADFPRLLVCAEPALGNADRSGEPAAPAAIEGLRALDAAKVDFIALACDSFQADQHRLKTEVRVPILDTVSMAIAQMAGPSRRVALVATRATIESGVFQRALAAAGHCCVESAMQDIVDALLAAARDPSQEERCLALWHQVFHAGEVAGADTTLLASFELCASARRHGLADRVVDSEACLASATVQRWLLAYS